MSREIAPNLMNSIHNRSTDCFRSEYEEMGMCWAAIWDGMGQVGARTDPVARPSPKSELDQATLILEGRLGRVGHKPVRIWAGVSEEPSRFSLYWMPDGSIRLYHGPLELATEPDMLGPGETFRVHYVVDRAGLAGLADIQNVDRDLRVLLHAGIGLAADLTDFLPRTPRYLEHLTLAAIATHAVPVGPTPCFEAGTPIDTPAGPVRVEDLQPGMIVNTLSRGPKVIRWVGRREILSLGSTAPILLRAPYFGLSQDIRVSPFHRMLMDGADVEYLFGEERVFVRVGDLVNGVSVMRDQTQATRVFHHFLLDDHDCVQIGRCRMETLLLGDLLAAQGKPGAQLAEVDAAPDYPTLDRAAAQTLLSLIAEHRRAAA